MTVGEVVRVLSSEVASRGINTGERDLQGAHGCIQAAHLQSPFPADTVAYGTMFTVQTHGDPVSIVTMEILANPVDSAMDVEIYTKEGDYQGAEADVTKWMQIVNTSVLPAREGRGTVIPMEDFSGVTMAPGEIRAFFVSLKSSDLRYRRAVNFQTGLPFHSDGYLSMNVGIGLADPGFGDRIYPNRMFSGMIHYTHTTDCNAPKSKSQTVYSFYAVPKGKAASKAEMTDEINKSVGDAIQNILDSDMSNLRDDHSLSVQKVESEISVMENGKFESYDFVIPLSSHSR